MLKRKITNQLLEWKKQSSRKAALILGARQIGKSTSAAEFGRAYYRQFIELNFIDDLQAASIFQDGNAREVLQSLQTYTGQSIVSGETLILLDEIQECPRARTMLKFLVQEGSADYIATGSLLGLTEKIVPSHPVGFEIDLPMYPLDFEEFCWAVGIPESTFGYLKERYEQKQPVAEAVHLTMMKTFFLYMAVGGMPEAVWQYTRSSDLLEAERVQKAILDLYRQDIFKYARFEDQRKIREIYDAIPSQLDAKNNRFKLSKLSPHARMNRFENSFLWLEEAGVALPCFNLSAPVIPLKLNEKRSLFKLYFCDTGLLCASSLGSVQYELLNGNLSVNFGSLLENTIAQELRSKNLPLYYYDQKAVGELDFLVQNGTHVDVLEIKSGNDYKKHAALNKARSIAEWHLDHNLIFCKGNVEEEDGILYLPLYMIMFYQPEEKKIQQFSLDLSALTDIDEN